MPLIQFHCQEHGTFDDLQGPSESQISLQCKCPKCEVQCPRKWSGYGSGGQLKGPDYDNDLRDPLMLQNAMQNRKWLEDNEHLRDSGYITVKENGPAFTRPHGNERPRKFY